MAIAVVCPKCGKKYQVPENRAGQKGKCRCGSMIQVPRVAQPAASDDPSRKAAERQQAAIPPSETRAQVPMAGQSRRKPVGPAPASPSTESRPAGGPQNPPGTSPSTPPIEEPIVAEVVEEPVAKKMAVAPSDTASKRPAPSQKTKENARTEESLRILVKLGNPQEVGICLTLFKYGRGLDIDSKGSDGCTALHIASMEGHVDIVRMLLKAGANPNAKADVRITPLHAAVLRGHTQVIEVLLAGGADLHAGTTPGNTPLHCAAGLGLTPVAKLLVSKGANVNAGAKAGTPLHFASQEDRLEMAEFLVESGANVNASSPNGHTPLHLAASGPMARFLVSKGAILDAKAAPDHNLTPLHLAAYDGRLEVVQVLIAEGAQVNARGDDGRTPAALAASRGHQDIVDLLEQHVATRGSSSCGQPGDAGVAVRTSPDQRAAIGGPASDHGIKCERCHGGVLETETFYREWEAAGGFVNRTTGEVEHLLGHEPQIDFGKRAFRCQGCGKIYCLNCLRQDAPPRPESRIACPACGNECVPFSESPRANMQPAPTGDEGAIERILRRHLVRIKESSADFAQFAEQFIRPDAISLLTSSAVEKLTLTLRDGQQHNLGLARKPVFFCITSLPGELGDAVQAFASCGGYMRYFDQICRSAEFATSGCSVCFHLVCGRGSECYWVQATVCSVREPHLITVPVIPVELLTPAEQERLGLRETPSDEPVGQTEVSGRCDVCNQPTSTRDGGKVFSPAEMREVTQHGFNGMAVGPNAQMLGAVGITSDESFAEWQQKVAHDNTDWLVCPECQAAIRQYTAQTSEPDGRSPEERREPPAPEERRSSGTGEARRAAIEIPWPLVRTKPRIPGLCVCCGCKHPERTFSVKVTNPCASPSSEVGTPKRQLQLTVRWCSRCRDAVVKALSNGIDPTKLNGMDDTELYGNAVSLAEKVTLAPERYLPDFEQGSEWHAEWFAHPRWESRFAELNQDIVVSEITKRYPAGYVPPSGSLEATFSEVEMRIIARAGRKLPAWVDEEILLAITHAMRTAMVYRVRLTAAAGIVQSTSSGGLSDILNKRDPKALFVARAIEELGLLIPGTIEHLPQRAAALTGGETLKIYLNNGKTLDVNREGIVPFLMLNPSVEDDAESDRANILEELYTAAEQGRADEVERLLVAGADPNCHAVGGSGGGATPLMEAAQRGHRDVARVLLSRGAKPDAESNEGATALILAAESGQTAVLRVLLDSGANPNASKHNGLTGLMAAAKQGHSEAVKLLLSSGAAPNAKAENGMTALMMASYHGHVAAVTVLLDAGADVNAWSKNGHTPLHVAASGPMARFLVSKGAVLDAKAGPDHNFTPLHLAAYDGRLEVVQVLIAEGANVNARGDDGRTPAALAASRGYQDIVDLLEQHSLAPRAEGPSPSGSGPDDVAGAIEAQCNEGVEEEWRTQSVSPGSPSPTIDILYPEEGVYYAVIPVEIMLVFRETNLPRSNIVLEMFVKHNLDVGKLIPSCALVLKDCPITCHCADSDAQAICMVAEEAVRRSLNAVSVNFFDFSGLGAKCTFHLAVLTTVPDGKKPHVIKAGEHTETVLRPRT